MLAAREEDLRVSRCDGTGRTRRVKVTGVRSGDRRRTVAWYAWKWWVRLPTCMTAFCESQAPQERKSARGSVRASGRESPRSSRTRSDGFIEKPRDSAIICMQSGERIASQKATAQVGKNTGLCYFNLIRRLYLSISRRLRRFRLATPLDLSPSLPTAKHLHCCKKLCTPLAMPRLLPQTGQPPPVTLRKSHHIKPTCRSSCRRTGAHSLSSRR